MSDTKYFGQFGGRYVPEMLQGALEELANTYDKLKYDDDFIEDLYNLHANYNNRPTPLIEAETLQNEIGGARIMLKNEGLNHTGAHKINHCLGQALVAQKLGKTRLIAETGAGQHGLATATVAAKFGMKCTVYMGQKDLDRQRPNVLLMQLLGAEVIPVHDGSKTLKDAVSAGIRDWMKTSKDTHYVIGSCLGPDPYPRMNRDFQSIIGIEINQQLEDLYDIDSPDAVIACVGGGSNALGAFTDFIDDETVQLIGVEAGGKSKKPGDNATRFPKAKIGVFEGYKSYFLQDKAGNSGKTHSISAGLDYIGVGPELADLHDSGRVEFVSATDKEVLEAVSRLARTEGIIPAMESAHAVAHAIKIAPNYNKNQVIVVNVSGRGDKDLFILGNEFGGQDFADFLKMQARMIEDQK